MDEDTDDQRSKDAKQFDATMDVLLAVVNRLDTLLSEERKNTNTQTVIHKTEGMGAWGAAAVTACFATMIGLLLIAMEIHDLKAWSDIYRGQITKILETKK